MEERILVALWECKPDCSGLQNEWEVRKRRQKTWTPLGRSLDERRKQASSPSKATFHLLEELGKEDWENLEAESDVPWTPDHTREASWESPKA